MRYVPFDCGLAFSYSHMGRSAMKVNIDDPTIPDQQGELVANVNKYGFQPFLRLRPVNPYLNGIAGFRAFAIRTKLNVESVDGPLSKSPDHFDLTTCYCWAAGLMIAVDRAAFINLHFARLFGGEATHVAPSTIGLDADGELMHETRTSRTECWTIQLGIAIEV